MLYLSFEGCKKSIMLRVKSCICDLWTKRKLLTEYQGMFGMGIEEERNTRSFG